MPPENLSTQSLLEVTCLFERSLQPIVDGEGRRLQGVPGWEVSRFTTPQTLSVWAECVGYAGEYPAIWRDERVPVELQADESGCYRYRSPETFRFISLPASEVGVYSIPAPKFLRVVTDLLDIPGVMRKGIEAPLLNGTLWHLGKSRIGSAHTDIWFVRGLERSVEAVIRHFLTPMLPDQGLVLSSGWVPPNFMRSPRNYRFAALRDVVVDYLPDPRLDIDLLHRILSAPVDGTLRQVLPVYFDEYSSTLTIRSNPVPWHIKGQRHAAAVKYMYGQALNGRWLVDAGEILAAAFPDKQNAKSMRIQNLFSRNDIWKDYIANPEWGKYGFRLD